jgi:hypothetical protein
MVCSRTRKLSVEQAATLLGSIGSDLQEGIVRVCEGYDDDPGGPLFYIADYPYADLLVRDGVFLSPCGSHPSCEECRDLLRDTSYSKIPLALVTSNAVEIFAGESRRTKQGKSVPLRILASGELFGVFETLDSLMDAKHGPSPWSVSSGARSIWILAPLGDKRLPSLLKPDANADWDWEKSDSHWSLVKAATADTKQWQSSILLFTTRFFERLKSGAEAASYFRQVILERAWTQSAALRHSAIKNAQFRAWFVEEVAPKINLPLGQLFHFATLCHLMSLADGDYPAFQAAAVGKMPLGPFAIFEQRIHHALKALSLRQPNPREYNPVVLQPSHLSDDNLWGYYSFRCPSLLGAAVPEIPSFSDIPASFYRTLELLQEASRSASRIDLERTRFFAQAGRFDLNTKSGQLPPSDFFAQAPKSSARQGGLYVDSPFLVAGLRLVRRSD